MYFNIIKRINKFFVLLSVLLGVLIAFFLVRGQESEARSPREALASKVASTTISDVTSLPTPFDHSFPADLGKRNVFTGPQLKTEEPLEVESPVPVVPPPSLKVIGLLVGGHGPEVVLEDLSSNESMTLAEGQRKGDLVVKRIGMKQVEIEYRGHVFQLKVDR